jgi:hypothetical protein
LEFFRQYWQYAAGVAELVEVARKVDIGAPAVFQDLAATLGIGIWFKPPDLPLMHLLS